MLNYENLIRERTIQYIYNDFTEEVVGSIEYAVEQW